MILKENSNYSILLRTTLITQDIIYPRISVTELQELIKKYLIVILFF